MLKQMKVAVVCAGLCAGGVAWADAVVIDFNDMAGGTFTAPRIEDGFVVDPALAPNAPAIDSSAGGNGTKALIFCGWCDDGSEGVSIYSQLGLTFSLQSLDVFSVIPIVVADFPGAGLVTGHFQGGGTISKSISALVGLNTVTFDSDWSNLASIDIVFETSSSNPFGSVPGIDNVTLQAVPVPAAIWFFASGLGLLGWSRRR